MPEAGGAPAAPAATLAGAKPLALCWIPGAKDGASGGRAGSREIRGLWSRGLGEAGPSGQPAEQPWAVPRDSAQGSSFWPWARQQAAEVLEGVVRHAEASARQLGQDLEASARQELGQLGQEVEASARHVLEQVGQDLDAFRPWKGLQDLLAPRGQPGGAQPTPCAAQPQGRNPSLDAPLSLP